MSARWRSCLGGAAAAVTAVPSMAACGGEDEPQRPAAPAQRGAPAALVGTYAMSLDRRDLPANAPRELVDGSPQWMLRIVNTGGVGGGPAFTLANDRLGTLATSRFSVNGDRIRLHDQECAVAPGPVESEYRWARSGRALRLTVVTNGCADDVARTLLTAGPWTR